MPTLSKEILLVCVLLLGQSFAQSSSDKQIRLEDIERDNLNSQKEQVGPINSNYHPAAQAHQQQIAAYQQQQYYLQQLQQQQQQVSAAQPAQPQVHPAALQGGAGQQVLLPQQVPYNAVPIMIIQQPLVDQLAQYYLMQQHLAALQYQAVPQAVQALPPGLAHPALVQPQVVHILPQQQLQLQQLQQQQLHQQQLQQPQALRTQTTNKPFRPSPPLAPAQPRPPTQTLVYTQQHYNPYNTIYQQQQQQKFLTGVKSTPAPTIKESQAPLQATQYATYKSF